jgi:hypothetical protein
VDDAGEKDETVFSFFIGRRYPQSPVFFPKSAVSPSETRQMNADKPLRFIWWFRSPSSSAKRDTAILSLTTECQSFIVCLSRFRTAGGFSIRCLSLPAVREERGVERSRPGLNATRELGHGEIEGHGGAVRRMGEREGRRAKRPGSRGGGSGTARWSPTRRQLRQEPFTAGGADGKGKDRSNSPQSPTCHRSPPDPFCSSSLSPGNGSALLPTYNIALRKPVAVPSICMAPGTNSLVAPRVLIRLGFQSPYEVFHAPLPG